jgi:hypothetical protein
VNIENPVFTAHEAEELGNAITEWAWEWVPAHPHVGFGMLWQRELTEVIIAHTGLLTAPAMDLAHQLTFWCQVWNRGADRGYVDADLGVEWRRSLIRFLMFTREVRYAWMLQPPEWQIYHVHFFAPDGQPFLPGLEDDDDDDDDGPIVGYPGDDVMPF